jgi:predicted secreted protein
MNPTGIVNGSKYLLYKTLSGGGTQLVGGLLANSSTYTRDGIDITNKTSQQFRELMDGDEGVKYSEHSCEVVFSSDAAYLEMRDDFKTGTIRDYVLHYGDGKTQTIPFKITNMSDSAERDTTANTSVTLASSSEFVRES